MFDLFFNYKIGVILMLEQEIGVFEILNYNTDTAEANIIYSDKDPTPHTLGIWPGGVYYIDENTFFYPQDQEDNHDLLDEYRPFNIWYHGYIRSYSPHGIGYYEATAEYYEDGELKIDDEHINDLFILGDIVGVVKFTKNKTPLNLNVGDIVELNNLIKAKVDKIINDKKISIKVMDHDYYGNMTILVDNLGNVISSTLYKDGHLEDSKALGWFNIKEILIKGEK